MNSIASFLSEDHRLCDNLFFQAESSVSKGHWDHATTTFREFAAALNRHLTIEEEILFPALDEAFGGSCGPTAVMRSEHQQVRQIVTDLASAIIAHDAPEFLGCSETLNIMVQQHNVKEENILYVMADKVLANRREEILGAIDGVLV